MGGPPDSLPADVRGEKDFNARSFLFFIEISCLTAAFSAFLFAWKSKSSGAKAVGQASIQLICISGTL